MFYFLEVGNLVVKPFAVGEQIRPNHLVAWTYTGLRGKPNKERDAVRRYRKGQWVIQIRACTDRSRLSRVMSVRTIEQDNQYWSDERQRRIRGVLRD